LQVGHELRAPHDVHGPEATCLREGNHPTPHARVGRILYDEVTALQIDVVAEQERRGRGVDRQHRELLRVRRPRQRKEAPGRDDHALAPGPARTRRNDPVTDRDVGDAGTDREHAPDPFIADNRRKLGAKRVDAPRHQQVVRVDGRVLDRHQHLVRTGRLRLRDVGDAETVNWIAVD
jgi:hypothetical protein